MNPIFKKKTKSDKNNHCSHSLSLSENMIRHRKLSFIPSSRKTPIKQPSPCTKILGVGLQQMVLINLSNSMESSLLFFILYYSIVGGVMRTSVLGIPHFYDLPKVIDNTKTICKVTL
jgi:hypothetical protein